MDLRVRIDPISHSHVRREWLRITMGLEVLIGWSCLFGESGLLMPPSLVGKGLLYGWFRMKLVVVRMEWSGRSPCPWCQTKVPGLEIETSGGEPPTLGTDKQLLQNMRTTKMFMVPKLIKLPTLQKEKKLEKVTNLIRNPLEKTP